MFLLFSRCCAWMCSSLYQYLELIQVVQGVVTVLIKVPVLVAVVEKWLLSGTKQLV